MERTGRVNLTQLLRTYRGAVMGLCGLMIVFFHCWITTVSEFPVIGRIEALIKGYGYFGVDVFFFLSGWGLTYSRCEPGSVRRFYAKRLRRVYVPYAEDAVLHCLIFRRPLRKLLIWLSGVELLTSGIYAYQWFVPAILLVYAVYPVLKRLLDRSRNDLALLGGLIAAMLLAGVLANPLVPKACWGILYRLPTFLLGVALGRLGQRRSVELTAGQCAALAAALLAAYYGSEYLRDCTGLKMLRAVQLSAFSLLLSCGVAWLCAWIDASRFRLMAVGRLGVRLLTVLGGVTLEMYVLQGTVFNLILKWFEGTLTYLQINLICMAVIPVLSLALAWFNQRLFAVLSACGRRAR